jgi:hypothetical protein
VLESVRGISRLVLEVGRELTYTVVDFGSVERQINRIADNIR